jgi:hypothetical protein
MWMEHTGRILVSAFLSVYSKFKLYFWKLEHKNKSNFFSNIFQSSSSQQINTAPYIIIRKLLHSIFNEVLELLHQQEIYIW